MKYPFKGNTPLSLYPYNSRTSTIEFQSAQAAANYILHGFKPGNALQASELNEIQENFYKNLTLSNHLLLNWIFVGSEDFTSGNDDPVRGPSWIGAVPFDPFKSISVSSNVITFKKAWYLVDDYSGIKFWIYNNNAITFTYTSTPGNYIGIELEVKKYITPEVDGRLYDNSNGFSNSSLSPGADRYQLNFVADSGYQNTAATTNIQERDIFKISPNGTLRYLNNLVHKNS